MLYTPVQLLAMFVRDLLNQPEGDVVILGRMNTKRDDFTALQITIDSLGPDKPIARGQKYDGNTEVMNHNATRMQTCTIRFYGDAAYEQLNKFNLLSASEQALGIKRSLGITVYLSKGVTDIKLLAGSQYSNEFELTADVMYNESVDIETLRIDTAQFSVISD